MEKNTSVKVDGHRFLYCGHSDKMWTQHMMFRKENCIRNHTLAGHVLDQTVAEVGVQHKHSCKYTICVCDDQFGLWTVM